MVTKRSAIGKIYPIGFILLGVIGSGFFQANGQSSQTETKLNDNAFSEIYAKSLKNLSQPDMTFGELSLDRPRGNVGELVFASSTTCSRRCSQRCSQGCTTTRGCSTRCKSYTEGCTGPGSSDNTQTSRAKQDSIPLGSIPRARIDLGNTLHLQMLLRVAGYDLSLTGTLDDKTYAAVVDFQKRNNLPVTGVADASLWKSLCLAIADAVK